MEEIICTFSIECFIFDVNVFIDNHIYRYDTYGEFYLYFINMFIFLTEIVVVSTQVHSAIRDAQKK